MTGGRETLVRVMPDAMAELNRVRDYLEGLGGGQAVTLSAAVRMACGEFMDGRPEGGADWTAARTAAKIKKADA